VREFQYNKKRNSYIKNDYVNEQTSCVGDGVK
jgi:hypothetical protein